MGMKIVKTKDYMSAVAQDRYAAYGNFLDRFKWLSNEERQEVIKDPPDNSKNNMEAAAVLAATVERLAKQYGIEVPEWVYDKKYTLRKHYYGSAISKEYRRFLRETALPEFAKRNLFLGDNVMDRY